MSQTNLVIHTYVQECLWFTLFVQTNRRCSGKANYKECNVYKQSLTGSCLSWFWFCWFWMTSGAGWFGGWAWALRLNGNQPAVCLHRRANGSEDYVQKIADLHYRPTHCLQDSFHAKIVDHACHLPSALHYSQLKDKLNGWTYRSLFFNFTIVIFILKTLGLTLIQLYSATRCLSTRRQQLPTCIDRWQMKKKKYFSMFMAHHMNKERYSLYCGLNDSNEHCLTHHSKTVLNWVKIWLFTVTILPY